MTCDQEAMDSDPAESGNILSWRFIFEIFSMVSLSFPLIHEGHLSVSGKRMCKSTGLLLRGLTLA